MSDGVTVDADVMALFALTFKKEGDVDNVAAKQLIVKIRGSIGFAIDAGGKIQQQWFATCGSGPFREWFVQSLKDGKIKYVVPKLSEQHKKKLHVDLGFPNDQFEITYVAVANSTRLRYLVAKDMHFFEPKHKKADQEAKSRSREQRKGGVCRYLRKELKITVGTVQHATQELWPEATLVTEAEVALEAAEVAGETEAGLGPALEAELAPRSTAIPQEEAEVSLGEEKEAGTEAEGAVARFETDNESN